MNEWIKITDTIDCIKHENGMFLRMKQAFSFGDKKEVCDVIQFVDRKILEEILKYG